MVIGISETNTGGTKMGTQIQIYQDYQPVIDMVVNSVSGEGKRKYAMALRDFLNWWQENGRPTLSKLVVQQYRADLTVGGVGSINLRLSAIRKLAREAVDNGLLDPVMGQGIQRVRGIRAGGVRAGNWLTREEAQKLLDKPDTQTITGLRDQAILAVFLGCGLRRSEVASLTWEHIQQRDGRWAIMDLVGKRNKIRSVPMPSWCRQALDNWKEATGRSSETVFYPLNKGGNRSGNSMSPQSLYCVVQKYAKEDHPGLAPHDLRRTYAKLAHKGGAELIQIQKSLGHSNVKVTEDYIGADQDFTTAPCDLLGLKLKAN
jgi:integrase